MLLTSCASMFSGSKAKVTFRNDAVEVPVTLSYDGKTETNVFLPYKTKIRRGFKATEVTATAKGYKETKVSVRKKFNPTTLWNLFGVIGFGIDAGTGAMTSPKQKEIYLPLRPEEQPQTNIAAQWKETTQTNERVTRDNARGTTMERTIIRWFFESDPKGARIYWRIISSVPDEVKNTNELYLGNTPFEETRSFNIIGLTEENARDIQIEIKVRRKGYMDQTKRFNVRQAIDQQEISSFFELIKEE